MPQLPMKALKQFAKGGGKPDFKPKKPGEAPHPPPGKGGGGGGGDNGQHGKGGGNGDGKKKDHDFGDDSHETMFSELEMDFPEVAELLEELADAHEGKKEDEIETAVGKLLDFLSGHGLAKHKGGGGDEDEKGDDHEDKGGDEDEGHDEDDE